MTMSLQTKRFVCTLIAASSMSQGLVATAAPPAPSIPAAIDLALSQDGLLAGRVVDPHGQPLANGDVTVVGREDIVCLVRTDAEGYFRVSNMKPGTFRLVSEQAVQVCRVWSPGTAPPAARQSVLLVTNSKIAAGQVSPLRYWLSNPNVVLALASVAALTPVIAHEIRSDRGPGS